MWKTELVNENATDILSIFIHFIQTNMQRACSIVTPSNNFFGDTIFLNLANRFKRKLKIGRGFHNCKNSQ